MQLVAAVALTVVLRAGPDAPPAVRPSAEAEVEEVLAATARKSPSAAVVVVVEGPDSKLYQLEEATVRLDGAPMALSVGAPSGVPPQGTEVSDGDHVVSARLVYRGQAFGPYPWQAGPRWALPARVLLKASHGLRLTIHLIIETNEQAPLAGQRLALRTEVEPVMLVALDDAPLPPPPLPHLPQQLPPAADLAPVATTATAPSSAVVAAALSSAPPPKKKTKKKVVARSTRASAVVPASAATKPSSAGGPGAETPDGLEQATARLRSALAAPRDGGPTPTAASPR